jgi:Zn-dependent protease with chaperone function
MEQLKPKVVAIGWDWREGLPQVLVLLSIVLAAYGTWRALQYFHGWALVASILACWLVPIVGALFVLSISRRRQKLYDHNKT